MDELKDVYNHFLLYYGRDIPKMQNAAKASRKKLKRIKEDGDEEGGWPERKLQPCWLGLVPLELSQILESAQKQELTALKFCSQVKVRKLKMRSRGDQSSSKPPAETCTPSARVPG